MWFSRQTVVDAMSINVTTLACPSKIGGYRIKTIIYHEKNKERIHGKVLETGFTAKLYKELLESLRQQAGFVSYLNNHLGIGWRNLSQVTLRDVPFSILMKIILNYAFIWDKEKFIMAGAKIAERIYNYAEDHLDAFNDPNEDDPAEDGDTDLTDSIHFTR